jgi:hypothetical protein
MWLKHHLTHRGAVWTLPTCFVSSQHWHIAQQRAPTCSLFHSLWILCIHPSSPLRLGLNHSLLSWGCNMLHNFFRPFQGQIIFSILSTTTLESSCEFTEIHSLKFLVSIVSVCNITRWNSHTFWDDIYSLDSILSLAYRNSALQRPIVAGEFVLPMHVSCFHKRIFHTSAL